VAPRAVSAAASARGWSFSVSMSAVQAAMRCSGETAVSSLGAQIAALVLSLALSLLLFLRLCGGGGQADGGKNRNAPAHDKPFKLREPSPSKR